MVREKYPSKRDSFRVILLKNGDYMTSIYTSRSKEFSYKKYRELINKNEREVVVPRLFTSTNDKIKLVKYEICVIVPKHMLSVEDLLKKKYSRVLQDWIILTSNKYNIEEDFYVMLNGKTGVFLNCLQLLEVTKNKSNDREDIKQVICVKNKLLIFNEKQFDLVMCKTRIDCNRLHHKLLDLLKLEKARGYIFMGVCTQSNLDSMYKLIQKKTGWNRNRTSRTNCRF